MLDRAARDHPEYDIFSCQMIRMADRGVVDCKGMRYRMFLSAQLIGFGDAVRPDERPFEVFGATGGAMLLRRRVWERLGLFDEAFYFNNEDVDFALRAMGAGFRTLYVPLARIYHRRSPNEAKTPDRVLYLIQRNPELAVYKNVSVPGWILFGPLHLAYVLYHFAKWAWRGKAAVVLRAKLDAVRLAPRLERPPLSLRDLIRAGGFRDRS